MKKTDAIEIVQKAFGGVFNEQSFQVFIANLLKNYETLDKVREGQYIREAFRQFISKYQIIGAFKDNEGNYVDILQVFLCKGTSLERARTAQRNFVADYLKNNLKVAALVAFIAPDEQDWRFSLVKMEYSLDVKEGKLKTSEEITPAKRWSFLVGLNEGSHTAQSRFVTLLESNKSPNLKELEEAFNIEKVTNEFFEKYCDLFLRMKESLDGLLEKDPQLKIDFESKEITTVDFAKKTLGQMAFLYFLQKKGWFGVAPSKEWGSGAKNFLRALFNARGKYGENFFDDVLEPLFYEALAQDRGRDAIYPRLNNCRMPFLNGGLFEPMNGYSWETTHISLPDELFSNSNKTKEGDTGDGILDVFDRYNFTVNENEPLEKEVAVDPEMLGKVFENLLEIRDRKSKGAFYTPREIVHYMCQESLINYLQSETGETISREDLELFIQKGVQIIQNDKIVLERNKKIDSTYKFLLPESIRASAGKLDLLLANIKVCDPAVGSGAFPLGMLNEIVRARQVLGVHSGSALSPYDLKLHTISHSIYGVDIDSGAVEIAKLRMWLALVVEEKDPHPLPNLEHKIMQGNSLLSEYEGIKLFDDSFLTDTGSAEKEKAEINEKLTILQREYFDLHSKNQLDPVKKLQIERDTKQLQKRLNEFSKKPDNGDYINSIGLFDAPAKQQIAQEKTEKLQRKIEQFISESRKTQKQDLKEEIDNLKWELIEATLEEQGRMDKLADVRSLRKKNIRPFFIWKLEFSDVFRENGGFDIVIGNPPYGANIDSLVDTYRTIYPEVIQNYADIYKIFFDLGFRILKKHGTETYITPNTYLAQPRYKDLRAFILKKHIFHIINLGEKVFEGVVVPVCISIIKNEPLLNNYFFSDLSVNGQYLGSFSHLTSINVSTEQVFSTVDLSLMQNFTLKDDELFANTILEIRDAGIQYHRSGIGLKNKGGNDLYERLFTDSPERFPNTNSIWYGKKIDRYFITEKTDEYFNLDYKQVLNSNESVSFTKDAFQRKTKLLWRQTASTLIATIDAQGKWFRNTIQCGWVKDEYSSSFDLKYILSLFNSSYFKYLYQKIVNETAGRAFPQVKITYIRKLPIKKISLEDQKPFIDAVDQILAITSSPDYDPKKPPIRQRELEGKIDEMVFDLYELASEEREIILKS
ncbi:N-6 DNA methylase [Candidatus Peregrinibacteria bacterium]|nr:MAG: N-6 DNA methylase [Candidatus Peregrinibacteria bacterium]